ncbi:MAG: hypothetical protein OEX12_04605 [Gammaproteobacteria bacterium]|nr:hypothetical protein [Gammaproteobacteria bacterium]
MKKALLFVSICFSPAALASDYEVVEAGTTLSGSSNLTNITLSIQNHSINNLSDFNSPSADSPSYSTLSLRKTWTNDIEWKLYSTHHISTPLLLDQTTYSPPRLALSHTTSGLSVNNRLSLSKRYSNAFILTPAIGFNMQSSHGRTSNFTTTTFYPYPIYSQNNNNEQIFSINTGIDLNGLFSENWGYTADLEYAYLTNTDGMYAWKSEALFFYQWQNNSRVLVGYKYIDGQDNDQRNVQLYPVIDVLWSW